MYILITGAAGSGTSTLGYELSEQLSVRHIEADDYFWHPTDPPYQQRVAAEPRCALMLADLRAAPDAVVSGSVMDWGRELEDIFDLVVFLYVPSDIRLARLKRREEQRFGVARPEFLAWAAQYDSGTEPGRSLRRHREWLEQRQCEVLRLEGDLSRESRVGAVVEKLGRAVGTKAPHRSLTASGG
ncbi:putative cytidylate kinase [Paucimonas lemoignei]|jgi:adenylate kinase family enzyme|nr:putative cytidylate kinase [Paucimonas lemoignei]